jgi:dihydrolipoamide dehydrogenase
MKEYDVVVIGAGPGGYVSAIRASQNGLKTAIVEKEWMGGVCLNVGCIPSKALLKNADLAHTLRERSADFGISFDNLNLDYSAAVKRSRQVSDRLTKGVSFLMKKNNIEVFMGSAKLASKSQVDVTNSEGNTESLQAKNIVIATGARVFTPPTWKVDGEKIITYKEAILQESLPESVVIIGAGAIGVEFATIWNSYGVQVTLVEMLPQILPLADEEAAKELAKSFKKRGIEILTGHKVESVEATDQGVKIKLSGDDGEKELLADQALAAIGFRANSADLGLEDAGVKLDTKGNIEVDDRMATNVGGIWAIGDVTGKLLLAHIASKQGVICADAMAGKDTHGIDYQMAPSATYSQPQVAWFGMTEKQAQEAGYEIKVGKFPFSANGKALGLGESTGFAKIISDAQYGEILGAHMVGPEVSELLPELTLAQRMEMTAHEIAGNIHSHPTLSEVLMEAAEGIGGQYLQI